VSLYFFFAQGLKRRSPRFLTRRELEADGVLIGALSRICGRDGAEALLAGLAQAVERGTLLRTAMNGRDRKEEIYLVNTPSSRRRLRSIPDGLTTGEPLPASVGSAAENVFTLYEQNIGNITPIIADDLKEAEERYPAEWLRDAFREAVELNKRSWRYIERILRRWEAEGRDNEERERDTQIEWLEQRYVEGKQRLESKRRA